MKQQRLDVLLLLSDGALQIRLRFINGIVESRDPGALLGCDLASQSKEAGF